MFTFGVIFLNIDAASIVIESFAATWVDRFSVDTSETWDQENIYVLTPTQSNKFSHFFTTLLDHDQDDLISEQDFEALIEVGFLTFLINPRQF